MTISDNFREICHFHIYRKKIQYLFSHFAKIKICKKRHVYLCVLSSPQQPQTSGVAIGNTIDLRASIETIEDNKDISLIPQPQRPVYAAPSLMSVRSCFVYPANSHHVQNHFHQYAQSQPQLSQSYSNPYIARMSNSADHLVSSSLNQLHSGSGNPVLIEQHPVQIIDQHPVMIDQLPVHPDLLVQHDPNATLPFHEQVKNSAAHLVSGQKVTVVPDSDVNVIGTAVRIQVRTSE